jgi:hypothetical protein
VGIAGLPRQEDIMGNSLQRRAPFVLYDMMSILTVEPEAYK